MEEGSIFEIENDYRRDISFIPNNVSYISVILVLPGALNDKGTAIDQK
jgi:hypothetical protein